MKYLLEKDKKKRYLFRRKEFLYKAIQSASLNDPKNSFLVHKKYNLIYHGSSRRLISNRCILTNRSRSIYRIFGISRIKLREFASSGLLPGIRKSSW